MTAEDRRLAKAWESLAFARHALSGGFAGEAGRASYMAAYHAAQAYTQMRTGKMPKTHGGARSEFTRLAQTEPSIDRAYTSFLARAYELKAFADYDLSSPVLEPDAAEAIAEADRFVSLIQRLLSGPST